MGERRAHHLMYLRWSFMITSMKSSTVAGRLLDSGSTRRGEGERAVFVPDEDFAVQHLVVSQDVVQHLLVQVLWRALEGNLHSPSLLGLEVDVSRRISSKLHFLSSCALTAVLGSV